MATKIQTTVSIHASSREDATMILFRSRTFPGVQSTRPRARTRHDFQLFKLLNQSFNPCVLAGGRDHTPRYRKSHKLFQSTRPHGRTRQINHDKLEAIKVSIHASSREDATCFYLLPARRSPVSIHASSREDATRAESFAQNRRGVSIHASSREDATLMHN